MPRDCGKFLVESYLLLLHVQALLSEIHFQSRLSKGRGRILALAIRGQYRVAEYDQVSSL